jgi:LmbE family N-acetylglucosaminyl deacetylase
MDNFNILVVYPHPADSATEASGTVALHAERGDKVTSVIATYGERHHMQWLHDEESKPESERDPAVARMTLGEYRDFKKREAERIADVLGVSELLFLGWNDHEIYFDLDKVAEVAEVIRRVRPDIVITHIPIASGGVDNDHANTGRIVMKALETVSNRVRHFDGVDAYHGVKQVFFSFAAGEEANSNSFFTPGIVPDVWVDTTSVIDKKVRALDQLVSQGYHGETARWIVEARDGRWGMVALCAYAEPFLRPTGITYDSLPMPPRVVGKEYEPTVLHAGRTSAYRVPSATPPEAYLLHP